MGSGSGKIVRKIYQQNCREKPPANCKRKQQANCKQKQQEKLPRKMPEIAAYAAALFRNNAARDELARIVRQPARSPAKELSMRNRILAIAAIAAAISTPIPPRAQNPLAIVLPRPLFINAIKR